MSRRTPRRTARRPRSLTTLSAVLALLVGSGTACGAATEHSGLPDPAPANPAHSVALGMYYGDRPASTTDAELGVTPAIHLTYVDWTSNWSENDVLTEDAAHGQTSLVNWEPFDVDLHAVVAGGYDQQIIATARGAATLTCSTSPPR
jgi:hypothetical protein